MEIKKFSKNFTVSRTISLIVLGIVIYIIFESLADRLFAVMIYFAGLYHGILAERKRSKKNGYKIET